MLNTISEIKKIKVNKSNYKLKRNEQNKLMVMISNSDSFEEVEIHFNRLYDSLMIPLWSSLTAKFVPPLSSDDIKDIFQEAWIKILENRKKYNKKNDVFNWVYTIKKNMIIDKIRKMKKYQHISISIKDDDDEIQDFDFQSLEVSVEDKISDEEKTNLLRNTIYNIKDETIKDLLIRRIIHDEKLEKIVQDTGIPLTTVYKKIQKGISIIKPEVEKILTN
jgi:RNA polymerase sigma factor (sigma-70 family)